MQGVLQDTCSKCCKTGSEEEIEASKNRAHCTKVAGSLYICSSTHSPQQASWLARYHVWMLGRKPFRDMHSSAVIRRSALTRCTRVDAGLRACLHARISYGLACRMQRRDESHAVQQAETFRCKSVASYPVLAALCVGGRRLCAFPSKTSLLRTACGPQNCRQLCIKCRRLLHLASKALQQNIFAREHNACDGQVAMHDPL